MSSFLLLALVFMSIVAVILSTSRFKMNPFYALISISIILALIVPGPAGAMAVLKDGFGGTLGSIGLIIVFGTSLGVLLDKSGATRGMAEFILRFVKKDKSSRAIAITGAIAGLPIFCDSGFIVLSGLNNSLAKRSGIPAGRMAASLAIALFSMHCLVPPHPGITAASGIIGGNIGKLILLGTLLAVPGALVGYLWVKFITQRTKQVGEEMITDTFVDDSAVPGPLLSFLPVILPLLLISANSLLELSHLPEDGILMDIAGFAGNPVIALLIGVVSAIITLPNEKLKNTDAFLIEGIYKSGPILLITAAGGTFGAVIRNTGMGDIFSELLTDSSLGLIIPYLLAMLMKTAQGSSTVAAITASSIVAPMIPGLGLDNETGRLLALLAIGAGTMTLSHTNDSFFWVISKFSGISVKQTLRLFSTATIVVSIFTLGMVYLLSLLL